jgi:hypothetical protein
MMQNTWKLKKVKKKLQIKKIMLPVAKKNTRKRSKNTRKWWQNTQKLKNVKKSYK